MYPFEGPALNDDLVDLLDHRPLITPPSVLCTEPFSAIVLQWSGKRCLVQMCPTSGSDHVSKEAPLNSSGIKPLQPHSPWRRGICLLFLLFIACPALTQEAGKIISLTGRTEVFRDGRWRPVSLHETLLPGDVIRIGPGGDPTDRWVPAQDQCQQPA
jgi:hypothetical protein